MGLGKYSFFFLSVACSLGHSILPHRHQAREKQHLHTYRGHLNSHEHEDEDSDHKEDPSLPLFIHFSNTDYVVSKFSFEVKEKATSQDQCPVFVADLCNYTFPKDTFSESSPKEKVYNSSRARPPLLRAPPFLS